MGKPDKMYSTLDEYIKNHEPVPSEQWNDEACLKLALEIIRQARNAYTNARQNLAEHEARFGDEPKDAIEIERRHVFENDLRMAREFFNTEFFSVLSLGKVSGEDVIADMDRRTERAFAKKKRVAQYKGIGKRHTMDGGIRFEGAWFHNLSELADYYGILPKTLNKRLKYGMTLEQAVHGEFKRGRKVKHERA